LVKLVQKRGERYHGGREREAEKRKRTAVKLGGTGLPQRRAGEKSGRGSPSGLAL